MPSEVCMKKEKLLKKIEENLVLHKELYVESLQAFKENYTDELNKMLKFSREETCDNKEERFKLEIDLIRPCNHEEDYKHAIEMIKSDCREEIVLREDEFKKYVLNCWMWIHEFKNSYLSNMSSCSSSSSLSSSARSYFSGT